MGTDELKQKDRDFNISAILIYIARILLKITNLNSFNHEKFEILYNIFYKKSSETVILKRDYSFLSHM